MKTIELDVLIQLFDDSLNPVEKSPFRGHLGGDHSHDALSPLSYVSIEETRQDFPLAYPCPPPVFRNCP